MENKPKHEQLVEEGFPGQTMIVLSPDRLAGIQRHALARNLFPTATGFYPHASRHQRDRKNGTGQHILLYCVSGKGWVKVNGEEHQLNPNTYFILQKDKSHSYGSSSKDPWSIYWIHFSGKTADLLFERYASLDVIPASLPYDPAILNTFHQIFSILENNLGERETEMLYIRLLHLLSAFIYTDHAGPTEDDDRIATSISFMKSNLQRSFSVKELADSANYSVSRYSELFRERTGYSPIQYFLQLKIQKSCQYLYFTKMNIKEICKEIGFDDQFYFSRMFRKQMNVSPLQYRKTYKT